MKIRNLTILAALGLSACAMPIPVPTPAPVEEAPVATATPMSAKERFVSAVEAKGCTMNPDNVLAIMEEAQVNRGDLDRIVPELVLEGRAAPAGKTSIRVITPSCTA